MTLEKNKIDSTAALKVATGDIHTDEIFGNGDINRQRPPAISDANQ